MNASQWGPAHHKGGSPPATALLSMYLTTGITASAYPPDTPTPSSSMCGARIARPIQPPPTL